MPEEPTIEDLMQEIVSLRDKVESLTTENESTKEALNKAAADLESTRKLNSDLLNRLPVNGSQIEQPKNEDSFENLVQETIDKILNRS